MSKCLADMSIAEIRREVIRTNCYRSNRSCEFAERHAEACDALAVLVVEDVGKGSAYVRQQTTKFTQMASRARGWLRANRTSGPLVADLSESTIDAHGHDCGGCR